MTDTEKLIELLYNCPDCRMLSFGEEKRIANYLVYHGVTVRENGEWVHDRFLLANGEKAAACSKCGCAISEFEYDIYVWDFCPNCGADMRKEKE